MSDIIIAYDPSYTRTGICILKDKSLFFETASHTIGEKHFLNVYTAAKNLVSDLRVIVDKYTEGASYKIVMEQPLPCSSMSSALYALDILILKEFEDCVVQTYNPATLRSRIHGHKYDKHESVDLAYKYLEILKAKGYIIESVYGTKRKIPHDCCEAFLYLHLYLHDLCFEDFSFNNEEDKRLYKEKQKLLKSKAKQIESLDLI